MKIGFDPAYGDDKAMIVVFDPATKLTLFIDPEPFGAKTSEEIEGVIELMQLIQPS